jgi:hypothetical protein
LEKEKKDGPATLHRSQSLDRLLQQAQKVLRGGCLCDLACVGGGGGGGERWAGRPP